MLTVALLASLLLSYALPILADEEPEEDDGPPEGVPKGPKEPKEPKPPKVRYGQRGNSNVAHMYLFAKDPETWEIVRARGRDRTWAKLKYNLNGDEFKFVLNAHGMDPEEVYSLIYYPDPWPGEGLISLGNGTANNGGNVHIAGSVDTGDDLPIPSDWNNIDYEGTDRPEDWPVNEDYNGAKLWLVFSSDVDFENQRMTGWHPTGYLFEYDLITFDYPN